MGLTLIVGPANSGKVSRVLDRYLEALDQEPFLVVPTGAEVEVVERELLSRAPALLGGSIGTFDDLFRAVSVRAPRTRGAIADTHRRLLLGEIVRETPLNGLGKSARFPGFVDALGEAIAELESAMVPPSAIEDDLGRLHAAYRARLEELELEDRASQRRAAAEAVAEDLSAWSGRPVFAYGFEDLTGTQWKLLEVLAGRSEVLVSLPYEPGRSAFSSLQSLVADIARLAGGRIEELPPAPRDELSALEYIERRLFQGDSSGVAPPLRGAIRFLEGAGSRSTLELVADEVLALLRGGMPAEEIGVLVPSVDRTQSVFEAVFASMGIPFAVEGRVHFGRTPFGHACLSLLRFAWLGGTRNDLFNYLRSRYSGLTRYRTDFVDGRLRGRGISEPDRVIAETVELLGHRVPALDALRAETDPVEAARALLTEMTSTAYGLETPPSTEASRLDLRARESAGRVLDDLSAWRGRLSRDDIVAALERAPVRLARAREAGRVALLDLLRARTRRFAAVFVLGLEEGVFPQYGPDASLLSDEARGVLEETLPGSRIRRPDAPARQRYLFYTACTRPRERLTLVREAATEDGRPREPSPFWDEVRSLFPKEDASRWTRRRSLSEATWPLERAPTERERLRSVAALVSVDEHGARALARANGWERKIERALGAFSRPTRLVNPLVLEELRTRDRFSVTEVEQYGDCSSMWFFEKVVSPRDIDAELDARIRGSIAHQALHRFYSSLPKELGVDQVDETNIDSAVELLRACVASAVEGGIGRLEISPTQRIELAGTLQRDLEQFLRQELALSLPLAPRRFEVSFGSERAAAELKDGLDFGSFKLSGKIDRVDVDPFSARGIVQDYKLGVAHSAAQIELQQRLQVPLYVVALRDLLGIEPLGGLYRGLSGKREARGILRSEAKDDGLPGLASRDYVDDEEFWSRIERARESATLAVDAIHEGRVAHDPRRGQCPHWCDLWPMCRVDRA